MKKVIFVPGIVDTGDYSHPAWSQVTKIADEIAKIASNCSISIWSSSVAIMLETARAIGEELKVRVEEHSSLHAENAFLYHAGIAEKEMKARSSASDIIIIVLGQELIYELSGLLTKYWSRTRGQNVMLRKGEAAIIDCQTGEVNILYPD